MDVNNTSLSKIGEHSTHDSVSVFELVRQKIMQIRNCQVILDADIAALYGVETKRVNEAVKNNPDKFPEGYMFKLTKEETAYLRSKNSAANQF